MSHVTVLTLPRLSRPQSTTMIERITAGTALPQDVLDQLLAKTDGVPLFVEELTKTVLESGLLGKEGDRYALTGPLLPLAIPATVQDALMAQLDRLGPVKEVAQLGAVLGREFPYEVLAAMVPERDHALVDALQQLIAAGLLFGYGHPPAARYRFKHGDFYISPRKGIFHDLEVTHRCSYWSAKAFNLPGNMKSSLGIKSLDHPTQVTHLAQMLIQFPKELSKHMSHGPLIRTSWAVRWKGDPPRYNIQVLELELPKEGFRIVPDIIKIAHQQLG
jgi:hypothetical protein